jgi:hypothetical protein
MNNKKNYIWLKYGFSFLKRTYNLTEKKNLSKIGFTARNVIQMVAGRERH